MKGNDFTLKKARSRQYPTKTITDADYADDIALLVIHLPKPNPCYTVWSRQQVALASM